jgi:hypothetical protein
MGLISFFCGSNTEMPLVRINYIGKQFSGFHRGDMKMSVLWVACCLNHHSDRLNDGGSKHLRNVGNLLPDYMGQEPRRQTFSAFTVLRQIVFVIKLTLLLLETPGHRSRGFIPMWCSVCLLFCRKFSSEFEQWFLRWQ